MPLSMVDDNRFTFAIACYRLSGHRRAHAGSAEKRRAHLGERYGDDIAIGKNPPKAEQGRQSQARPAI